MRFCIINSKMREQIKLIPTILINISTSITLYRFMHRHRTNLYSMHSYATRKPNRKYYSLVALFRPGSSAYSVPDILIAFFASTYVLMCMCSSNWCSLCLLQGESWRVCIRVRERFILCWYNVQQNEMGFGIGRGQFTKTVWTNFV